MEQRRRSRTFWNRSRSVAAVVLLTLLAGVAWAQPTVPVEYSGTCLDPEDGDLSGSLIWTSDIQSGLLGSGPSVILDLIEGSHIITARCQDAEGLEGSASLPKIIIINDPPVVTIEEVTVAALRVTGDAAITGSFGLQVEGDRTVGWVGHRAAEGAPKLSTSFNVRTTDVQIPEGVEWVVMRGADAEDAMLFDMVVRGTVDGTEAFVRAALTDGTLVETPALPMTETSALTSYWISDPVDGEIAVFVNDQGGAGLGGLEMDHWMVWTMFGIPNNSFGSIGYLHLDDFVQSRTVEPTGG